MWKWILKLFGIKPIQLEAPPCPLMLSLKDNEEVISEMEPNLYQALAQARQEALDPILPESLKEAVNITVNKVFPETFKKHLITKTDLILIGKHDVIKYHKDMSDDEWNIVKCFSIKILNDNHIKAESSTTGTFISCDCQQILKTIKDVPPPATIKDMELPVMNSVGIYR